MGSVGPGGRAVAPERAPETRWRVLLASRSLPNNLNSSRRPCFGTRLCATEPGGRLGGPLGSLTS